MDAQLLMGKLLLEFNMHISISMPQNWYPKESERNFKLDDSKVNLKEARRFLMFKKNNTIETIKEASLIRIPKVEKCTGDIKHEIGLIEEYSKHNLKPHLVYYVEFKEYTLYKMTCVTQARVYNEGGYSGITKHVFFEILLDQYDAIATDVMQSADGRRFWENQIYEAFDRHKFVYFADFKRKRFEQVYDVDDFKAIIQNRSPWG